MADTPPETKENEYGWFSSDVVIVFCYYGSTGSTDFRMATYEIFEDGEDGEWVSYCSERWHLKHITHWMPLPEPPQ